MGKSVSTIDSNPEAAREAAARSIGESEGLVALSRVLRVLADPHRLAVLRLLTKREACVCEIREVLALPQPLVSHHLGVLREAELVRTRRSAQWVYYSLEPSKIAVVWNGLGGVLGIGELPPEAQFGASTACCEDESPARPARA